MKDPTTTLSSPTLPQQPNGTGWGLANKLYGPQNPNLEKYLIEGEGARAFIRLTTDKGPVYICLDNIGGWGPDDADPSKVEILYKDGVLVIARGIIESPDEIAGIIASVNYGGPNAV